MVQTDKLLIKMKPIKISGVELDWIDRENLRIDRLTLGDLGLKMLRLTKKYWLGVRQLSRMQQTSPFFLHQMAAQRGTQAVYDYLEELGFTWNSNDWVKVRGICITPPKGGIRIFIAESY